MENNKLLPKKEELKKLEGELALMQERSEGTSENMKKLEDTLEKLRVEIENEKKARSVKSAPGDEESASLREEILKKNEMANVEAAKVKEETEKALLRTKEVGEQKMEEKIKEEEERWTEEDENTLNELLKFIENTKKEIDEIKKEIENRKDKKEKSKANITVETEDKKENVESFTPNEVKNKMIEFLQSQKAIQKINKLDIEINKDEILSKIDFEAEKKVSGIITAIIENKKNNIGVKDKPEIEAGFFSKKTINFLLTPQLDKISDMFINSIEKEKNKKVEKIWIESGQLKVKYKK